MDKMKKAFDGLKSAMMELESCMNVGMPDMQDMDKNDPGNQSYSQMPKDPNVGQSVPTDKVMAMEKESEMEDEDMMVDDKKKMFIAKMKKKEGMY